MEQLIEAEIVKEDIKQLALLTLYACYQTSEPERRAEEIYSYFSHYPFQSIHMEDMFRVGRENLTGTDQFWKDWIDLLKTKTGDAESRLLKEAVLLNQGAEGLVKLADKNCGVHPSLYLDVMELYGKNHDYVQMEEIGKRALAKVDSGIVIRGGIARKTAWAASCLGHTENVKLFCWETFRSDTTVRNLLRLFGTEEMARQYGIRGKEILVLLEKGSQNTGARDTELGRNIMGTIQYNTLSFYTGDFLRMKNAAKNPERSLGWSGEFVGTGIRLFLLYLFENPLPTEAAAQTAELVGCPNSAFSDDQMDFERKIEEESRRYKTSIFWNYFQRWKRWFPMEQKEKKEYLSWAEKIVYSRAEAIVGGQYRGHYGDAARLLALTAEVKEQMGEEGAKQEVSAKYKKMFPRHSSFQSEMKSYFNRWK